MEQLRRDPRVPLEGLPPVEQLALAGPESHRYVRQDDPLWDQLHAGVLTTGLVRGALGLYEKTTAKKLGIPSGRSGHGELLKAYHHLCHQPSSSSSSSSSSADLAAAAVVAAHNAAAVVAFNAAKGANGAASSGNDQRRQDVLQGPAVAAVPAAAAADGAGTEAAEGKSKGAKKRLRKKQAKAAAALQAAGLSPDQHGSASDAEWGISEERKLRKGRALSSLGLLAICCSWGSAQEAAALLQVAGAFPASQLAEVGLCRLQPELLPASWGFGPGSLPPIGASPDALIRHRMAASAGSGAGAAGAAESAENGDSIAQAATANIGTAAAGAAVGPWDIDGLLKRLRLAGTEGSPGAAAASSTGSSSVAVVGGLGASTNGPASSSSSNSNSGSGEGSSKNPSSASGAAGSSGAAGYLIEVVEVKNTCPFGHSRRGGRLRTSEFAVADKGPRQGVPPEWVPQIQLHMLCAGTPSGLLVSRSATKGTRVFRLHRDDELLCLMLLVISRLWQQHVLRRQPPPPGVYASWREHHDMVKRILEVARGAQLVATIEEGYHLPGGDSRWFLD
ncbi:Restriction endonuclease type II-like [Chlorella sorokiniana]|uniref:Restriction endonuclease type II-like n=1 Tax=Chlorella sorokiniana TaxID=3076 RepID=A0A2P6TIX3_CHLSO|nr:Restriction endonuclease type II-like [Chlorella sorokiniana]|eukprot:PRW39169.1 Restriction endonuclease type II-like [Chlorella sorokiniana]